MTMADKIVVMHDGLVEQIGAPLDLYDKPDNLFVAGLHRLAGHELSARQDQRCRRLRGSGRHRAFRWPRPPNGSAGRPAIYGVRPEHFALADDGAEAVIQIVEPTGSEIQVSAKLGGEDIVAVFRERHQFKPGDKIRLKPDPQSRALFDDATGKRLNA